MMAARRNNARRLDTKARLLRELTSPNPDGHTQAQWSAVRDVWLHVRHVSGAQQETGGVYVGVGVRELQARFEDVADVRSGDRLQLVGSGVVYQVEDVSDKAGTRRFAQLLVTEVPNDGG